MTVSLPRISFPSSTAFDSIYVIESLEPGAPRTGRDIHDNFLFPWASEEGGTETAYRFVNDSSELFGLLASIRDHTEKHGRAPILQFDFHGNESHFSLASNETLAWQDLANPLAAINRASRFNLLIISSACFGYYLGRVVPLGLRAPAWGIVGPKKGIKSDVLYSRLESFYRVLLEKRDLTEALERINPSLPYDRWTINVVPAEVLFCQAFRRLISNPSKSAAYGPNVNEMVAKFAPALGMDVTKTAALRDMIVSRFGDNRFWFEQTRRRYLMLDLFAENESRFNLTYDQCCGAA